MIEDKLCPTLAEFGNFEIILGVFFFELSTQNAPSNITLRQYETNTKELSMNA
jgi:hypothetical protein